MPTKTCPGGRKIDCFLARGICHAASDAIFVKDLEGRFIYVNPSAARLFGASADEVVGTTDDDWFGPAIGTRNRADDRVAIAKGNVSREHTLELSGGARVFSTTKMPYVDESGDVIGVVGIARDITEQVAERRAFEAERELFARMAAAVPGTFVALLRRADGTFAVPYAAESVDALLGLSVEALQAHPAWMAGRVPREDRPRIQAAIERSAEELSALRCDMRYQHPTRGEVWLEIAAGPARQPDGGTLWHGILLDITERKRFEHELREKNELLEGILATAPGAICSFQRDTDGVFSFPFVSEGLGRLFGSSPEEIARDAGAALGRIHPEDMPRVQDLIVSSAETLVPWHGEYRVSHPERGELWLEGLTKPVRHSNGAVIWHGIILDITERKRIEAELRASESTLRAVVETVPNFLMLLDRDGQIRFINHALSGFATSDVVGGPFLEPSTGDLARTRLARVFETGVAETFETTARTPSGELRWFDARIGPVMEDGRVVAVAVALTDVTDRRLAEERVRESESALRMSEERYRMLIEFLPDAVFLFAGGKIVFCNPAFVRLAAAPSMHELLGRDPLELMHPNDHDRIRARVERMRRTGLPAQPEQARLIARDGTERRVLVVAAPVLDNKEDAILVVLHDVTDKDKTERLLASVLESASDAIVTIDAVGTILAVNSSTSRFFGYAVEELVGRNVAMLMPEPHRSAHDGHLRGFRQRGTSSVVGREREVLALRKDGTTFPVELSVSGFSLNGKRHFTGVIRDVTERRKLEDQFRQAHKMEAFGQLAGGVAHDFNNLLTVIIGECEMLAETLEHDQPAFESISAVNEAAERAASLTRQLLAFSRKTVLEPKTIDVNAVVRDTEKLLRRLIGEDIHLTTRLTPNAVPIHVDPGQLTQVLINLAVNSRDAMPKGGELEIRTYSVVLEDTSVYEGLSPGRYVAIAVRDSGVGMTEEVKRQVFQPFFTTKEVGKGTGLGLAVVYGVVTQSGGAVRVQSRPGQGTTFEILLPITRVATVDAETEERRAARQTVETVLVVEDDEAVRRFAMRVLAMNGYRVVVAPDGAAAMTMLQTTEEPIHLVVTDVVMPVMSGAELGDALHEKFPAIKVLYVSGYTDDVLLTQGLESHSVDFLAKPYSGTALVRAIERVLARG